MINTIDSNDILQDRQSGKIEDYALLVDGDSMEPEFPDRCEVIIHPTDSVYNGAYVFAEVEGVNWFRKYVRDKEGARLVAVNSMIYPDITLEKLEWKILGVVVQRKIEDKITYYKQAAVNGLKVPMLFPR
ncbi:MAG: S24 family peptidase [Candidatus Sedimenticola sp. (ex Thyasira tokunagai)]